MNTTSLPDVDAMRNLSQHDNATVSGSDVNGGEDPEEYLYDLGTRIFVVVDMILVLFGCVGNILTFLVSLRKQLRSSPVTVFIAALAVCDTIVLVLDWLNNWLEIELKIQPLENFEFCVFHRWFFNVAYTTSAWLVAGVAVERLIVVWFPLTAKIWCTVRNSLIAVISFPIIISLLYVYNFWMWENIPDAKCEVNPIHAVFMNDVSPWFTAVLYSYIPLLIIVICSILITSKLISASRKRSTMTGDSETSNETRKVTITVMAISAAFICLTVPLTVWYIWVFAAQEFANQGPRTFFIEIMILIVGLTNHSINFFLYVLTSARFRSELCRMLCFRCRSGQSSMGSQHGGSSTMEAATKSSQLSSSVGSSLPSVSQAATDVTSNPAV